MRIQLANLRDPVTVQADVILEENNGGYNTCNIWNSENTFSFYFTHCQGTIIINELPSFNVSNLENNRR